MIKSENIIKVINNFKSVLYMATSKDHLRMGVAFVNQGGHTCGTVHCHGGWYAIATLMDVIKVNAVDYGDGANKMAEDIGFDVSFSVGEPLCTWAKKHPELWGNNNGEYMFSAAMAFYHKDKRPCGAMNLEDIINHWEDVYERVRATEYPDITSELAVLPINETSDKITQPINASTN